ncbi:hypothetical protein LBMAG18_13400 [Alphaproteobacteria bacterium]|nr:hypothetical protein LBMAG18_13400 [Alphaproteobacteria bacterium]
MRVGIWLGEIINEQLGGASTFQSNILKEISQTKSNHQFYFFAKFNPNEQEIFEKICSSVKIFNLKESLSDSNKKTKFHILNNRNPGKTLSLDDQLKANKIEFCWIVCPYDGDLECPYALTVWDLDHRLLTFFPEVNFSGWKFDDREKYFNKMIGKSSYVIIGNNEGARQVNQFYNYPIERVKAIAMPTPSYVYELKGEENFISNNNLIKNKYFFYPAQFWPHKNHIAILNAFKILIEKNEDFKNFKIVFTGSDKGNQKYIKEKTKEIGLENYVNFLGFVSKEQIIALYQNAFALIYPSMFGPDNIPPLEAMALKCPVISSNARGMEEQLQNCALFFNPLDSKDLVNRILELYNNPKLADELVIKGVELAKKVNTNNYLDSIIKIIDEFALIRQMWSSEDQYIHP